MPETLHPALTTGAEVLAILRERVTDESLQRLNALLDRRAAELEQVDPAALPALQEQQMILERELRKAMVSLQGTLTQAQQSGAMLDGVRRLLKPPTVSRHFSEKR